MRSVAASAAAAICDVLMFIIMPIAVVSLIALNLLQECASWLESIEDSE